MFSSTNSQAVKGVGDVRGACSQLARDCSLFVVRGAWSADCSLFAVRRHEQCEQSWTRTPTTLSPRLPSPGAKFERHRVLNGYRRPIRSYTCTCDASWRHERSLASKLSLSRRPLRDSDGDVPTRWCARTMTARSGGHNYAQRGGILALADEPAQHAPLGPAREQVLGDLGGGGGSKVRRSFAEKLEAKVEAKDED